jgi:hypothetical protein
MLTASRSGQIKTGHGPTWERRTFVGGGKMNVNEAREMLRGRGAWLGTARNWLLWHKDPHGRLTWGSNDELRLTVKDIEDLALEVAAATIAQDIGRNPERHRTGKWM